MTSFIRNLTICTLALCGLALFHSEARAGVLLEPYLGYHTGKDKAAGQADGDLSGVSFGGRVGYQKLGIMGGLDFMTGSWTEKISGLSADVTPTQLGAFAGYNFPAFLRVYAAYLFQNKAKVTFNGSSSTVEGNGFKLGVGFTALPIVSINLEYATTTTNKRDGVTYSPEDKVDMYGLTVSFPFDL
jgi:hypothetical protein